MGTPYIFQKGRIQALPAGLANTPGRRVDLCIVQDHEAFMVPFRKRKKPGPRIEAPTCARLLFYLHGLLCLRRDGL